MNRILIILPVYNENKNISSITNVLLQKYLDVHVLIVEDASNDGTGEQTIQLCENFERVHLIRHEKRIGFSRSLLTGFAWAMNNQFDYVLTMDADFSHSPDQIQDFINKIDQHNLILGSRFIYTTSFNSDNFFRKYITVVGNIVLSKCICPTISDVSSGFRLYDRKLLSKLTNYHFKSRGFAIQIEIIMYTIKNNFCIGEIPIHYQKRKEGRSKATIQIALEMLNVGLIFMFQERKKK